MAADIQAAMTVIGRRRIRYDRDPIELYGTDLSNLILLNSWLAGVDLISSNLAHAFVSGTTFAGSRLPNTNLIRARLDGSDLTGAWMSGANLTDASLIGAVLTQTVLKEAILVRATLHKAIIDDTTDLTDADLTDALWPSDAIPPEGWERDTSSGRLKRADPSTHLDVAAREP
ncbi:MAG TPA: pentapeptide repeat-containing protein [Trebonia sp.]